MVERRIIWSPRAKSDLVSILDFYYRRNGTKTYSRKLNSAIRKSVRLLAKYTDIGIRTDVEHVRILVHGDYGIFYEKRMDTVEIISVWDNRQDPDKSPAKS